jgi:hypothetical protein
MTLVDILTFTGGKFGTKQRPATPDSRELAWQWQAIVAAKSNGVPRSVLQPRVCPKGLSQEAALASEFLHAPEVIVPAR